MAHGSDSVLGAITELIEAEGFLGDDQPAGDKPPASPATPDMPRTSGAGCLEAPEKQLTYPTGGR